MKRTLALGLGAGGHARVLVEILRAAGKYQAVALLDPDVTLWGTKMVGVPVVGGDDQLPQMRRNGIDHAFLAVGSIGDTRIRRALYELAVRNGFQIADAIHPHSVISPTARFGGGAQIMAGVIVNAQVRAGNNVILNTAAVIEHDCVLGDFVHIASGATLGGTVRVGHDTHIGAGATIRQDITIGSEAMIAAGAVVIRNVDDRAIVGGVPARPL